MPVYTDGTNLYATYVSELHEFAQEIGLSSTLYVEDGTKAYYYIGGGNIALLKALLKGVTVIRQEQLKFVSKKYQKSPPL